MTPPPHSPGPTPLPTRPPGLRRETYSPPDTLMRGLHMVGWSRFDTAIAGGLAPHRHDRAWEICLIVAGQVDWWVNGQVYEVGRGDVFITRPDELHGGLDAIMHPCELYWAILSLSPHRPTMGLTRDEAAGLIAGYQALEHRVFPGDASLATVYEKLLAEHRRPCPHAAPAARALTAQLLIATLRLGQAHAADTRLRRSRRTSRIENALTYIDSHLNESDLIAQAARQAGLRASQFRQRFLEEVGQPPHHYIAARRLAQAKAHLVQRPDWSVTRIAHALGFASSQYFATAFGRRVGMSPLAYRRRHAPTAKV